ncbi:GNAT family N-acetyltransferase [Paenibacillus lentus]|uniref:GNAT family N-acetyltransferase n=1 Tax=Paenibacillus lentus TaxID=1338368 RepID=UPI00364D9F70
MNIHYKCQLPTIEGWKALRKSAGWTIHTDQDFHNAGRGTLFGVSAYHNAQIIGMGRIVGDGRICFYIQDVVVAPEYERNGIGTEIMKRLLKYINENAVPNAVVALMSSREKEDFYSRFGFIKRTDTNGFGMHLPQIPII